jgi:hypothetical protein
VSKFCEIREAIQATSLKVARAVYQMPYDAQAEKKMQVSDPHPTATNELPEGQSLDMDETTVEPVHTESGLRVVTGDPIALKDRKKGDPRAYDRIVVMGHSLGSVVAYDTLNALLNEDLADDMCMGVASRTKLFLTFGSPLNKTAFLFRSQLPESAVVRESLAAAQQPMIVAYDNRHRVKWLNIHSADDWISGPAQLYDSDDERQSPFKVDNQLDREASTPLLAHTEYWHSTLLADELYKALKDEPDESMPPEEAVKIAVGALASETSRGDSASTKELSRR